MKIQPSLKRIVEVSLARHMENHATYSHKTEMTKEEYCKVINILNSILIHMRCEINKLIEGIDVGIIEDD